MDPQSTIPSGANAWRKYILQLYCHLRFDAGDPLHRATSPTRVNLLSERGPHWPIWDFRGRTRRNLNYDYAIGHTKQSGLLGWETGGASEVKRKEMYDMRAA